MREITLSNGLRVLLLPQAHLQSAYFGLWVAAGPVFETKENNGVSHFIEHIVFKGSETRSTLDIAQGADRLGATLNAYTCKEYTHFYTRALAENITEDEVDYLIRSVREVVEYLRSFSPVWRDLCAGKTPFIL